MRKERVEKLREIMRRNKGDVAIINTWENMWYFTGLVEKYATGGSTLATFVLTEDEENMVVKEKGVESVELETSFQSPISIPREENLNNGLVEWIKEHFPKSRRILVDNISVDLYYLLAKTFKDVDPSFAIEIEKLRSIKSDDEVRIMRKTSEITVDAMKKIPELLKPGVTGREIAAEIEYYVRKRGADLTVTLARSGKLTSLWGVPPSDEKMMSGPFQLDLTIRYKGYYSDWARYYSVGKLDERLAKAARITLEAQNKAIEDVKAGVDASAPYRKAVEVYREYGLDGMQYGGIGHGIGIKTHEYPGLRAGSSAKLEKNMIVCVEPAIYFAGIGGVRVEDQYLVKEDGAEPLVSLEHETWK